MKVIWKRRYHQRTFCRECCTLFIADASDIVIGQFNTAYWAGDDGDSKPCVKCPRCGEFIQLSMSLDRAKAIKRAAVKKARNIDS